MKAMRKDLLMSFTVFKILRMTIGKSGNLSTVDGIKNIEKSGLNIQES